ncbi:hypothetical protein JTB14_021424 [Gonioctena quinquepunctata]|nr:hypothetical protein JTB14_021424 [Gonioctena quinquepunctata]
MTSTRQNKKGEDELHSTIESVVTSLCKSEDFINILCESITKVISEKFEREIDSLKKQNEKFQDTIANQNIIINGMERKQEKFKQSLPSKNLRIYGVEENRNESCIQNIMEIINERMNLKVSESDVESCYRAGKFVADSNKPIMVKFYNTYHKHIVYNNRKLLKKTGIIIREDLTYEHIKLLKAAISRVGETGKVWTIQGKLFIKLDTDKNYHQINSMEDLAKI